ncbi:MAG: cytochrome c nitrite reductase small subunit [Verrucomicrobiia bacterium]
MNWYYKFIIASMSAGIMLGVAAYTFIYAEGYSYLTNNPAACSNCHVMNDYYNGWMKSSHKLVATCNDCHTPDGMISKYLTKAENGFWHSYAFTTGRFNEPIRIKKQNEDVVEQACRRCHKAIISAMDTDYHKNDWRVSCVRCHSTVGHQ